MSNSYAAPRLGIRLVALIQFGLSGLSLISGGVLLLLMSGQIQLYAADLTRLEPIYKGLIISGEAISLLGIVAAWGLGRQQRWGWLGSVGFQGLCLLNNALAVIAGQPPSVGTYVSAGVCTAMIGLLCLPQIRQPCWSSAEPEQIKPAN